MKLKILREGLSALLINIGGIIAGWIAASNVGTLYAAPWIIVMYPPLLGIRGAVNGMLSGKLSTALHLGTVTTRFTGNTTYFYRLIYGSLMLASLSGIIAGSCVFAFYLIIDPQLGLDIAATILCTAIVSFSLSECVTGPLTAYIALFSFRKGIDPDIMLYPISSTMTDIIATSCYIIVVYISMCPPLRLLVLPVMALALLSLAIFFLTRVPRREFRDMLLSSCPTIAFVLSFEKVAGFLMLGIEEVVLRYPSILLVYPILMDALGDIGSIFGSRTTTKLHLGMLKPGACIMGHQVRELFELELTAFLAYLIYSLIAIAHGGEPLVGLAILLSHTLGFPPIIALVSIISTLTFWKGLDPDDFVIPVEMACADCLATLSVAFCLTAFAL